MPTRKTRRKPAMRETAVQPAGPARSAADVAVERAAAEIRALGPEAAEFVLILAVVNRFHMWEDCPHLACRRAGACRGDDMVCFEARRGELKRKILKEVTLLMATASVSPDEFYDYLDEVTGDEDEADVFEC